MKKIYVCLLGIAMGACAETSQPEKETLNIQGTWKLLSATTIRGDSSSTTYMEEKEMIKVINATHFTFLNHDVQQGKDSLTASFAAGGGPYELEGNSYTEHLRYCSYRAWEGHDFLFTLEMRGDTLVQTGKEEIAELGINQTIIEKYLKL